MPASSNPKTTGLRSTRSGIINPENISGRGLGPCPFPYSLISGHFPRNDRRPSRRGNKSATPPAATSPAATRSRRAWTASGPGRPGPRARRRVCRRGSERPGQGRVGEAEHQHPHADQEKREQGADVAQIGQLVDGGEGGHQGHRGAAEQRHAVGRVVAGMERRHPGAGGRPGPWRRAPGAGPAAACRGPW